MIISIRLKALERLQPAVHSSEIPYLGVIIM
jgi:hypothetical protein